LITLGLITLGLCRALVTLALAGGLIPVTLTMLLSLTLALLVVSALGLLILQRVFLALLLLLSLSTGRLACGLVLLCALTRRTLRLALPVLTPLHLAALRAGTLRAGTLRTLALRGGFTAASRHGLS
jgi:hypothetical protein